VASFKFAASYGTPSLIIEYASVLPMESLLAHQGVRNAQIDLCGPVAPQLATERARYNDGLERERLQARQHITTAVLASHHELLSLDDWESECHETSIGE
jgi:hypothetical protein